MTEIRVETCEEHGLRYNAAAAEGCARCLRETGVAPTVESPLFEVGPQAGIAAALVLTVGLLFYGVHGGIVAAVQGVWSAGGGDVGSIGATDYRNQDVDEFLEFVKSPIVVVARETDPELDSMIEELEDPVQREALSHDEIQTRIDEIYAVLWGTDRFDD